MNREDGFNSKKDLNMDNLSRTYFYQKENRNKMMQTKLERATKLIIIRQKLKTNLELPSKSPICQKSRQLKIEHKMQKCFANNLCLVSETIENQSLKIMKMLKNLIQLTSKNKKLGSKDS